MSAIVSALLNSLDIGLLLFIIASGLTIVFGVLGILNFAHGALYMLGAYFAYTVIVLLGVPFWLAIPVAPLAVGVLSIALEKLVLRHVYDRHITYSLLLTFALLLVLDDSVRIIWGAGYQIVDPPAVLQGTFTVLGAVYPVYSLFIIVVSIAIAIAVWWLLTRTLIGKRVRAAALDREMAESIGIDVSRLYTQVFVFGAALAALGGVLAAPMRAIGPAMGDRIIIESFIVVIMGGLGSLPGAFVGALILGFIHGFGARWVPEVEIVLPYLAAAVVLLARPQGLMGRAS